MRRWIIAVVAPLLLSGCFTSDRPVIAAGDLAAAPDLAGKYWRVDPNDSVSIGQTEFRAIGTGYAVHDDSDDDLSALRLVQSHAPDLYTLVDDSDGDRSTYYLMRREHGHVWRLLDMDIDDEGAFAPQNVAFFDRVARKYGYSIKIGGEATSIDGPVENGRIADLFRDPEFLGAVRIKDLAVYLPMLEDKDAPLEVAMADERSAAQPLRIETPLPAGTRLAKPEGFAGTFLEAGSASGSAVTTLAVEPLADGRFALRERGGHDATLALLTLGGEAKRYLAVQERSIGAVTDPSIERTLVMVERAADGWTFTPVMVGNQRAADELNTMRVANMQAAARRVGLGFGNNVLTGTVTSERLLALLRDGQFTSGLRTDLAEGRSYAAAAAVRALIGKPD